MRDQIRSAASQAWQRPAESLYLGRASRIKMRYEVPTLRHDGTVRGHQRARGFFTRLPLVIFYLIFGIFVIIWYLAQLIILGLLGMDNGGGDFYGLPRWKLRFNVKAAALDGLAVPAGHALAHASGDVWLVIGPTAAAFTQAVDGYQTVLWTENGPRHPVLAIKQNELRWPDGSTMTFELPRGEHKKFRADRKKQD
jgi:hypothetical protein